MVKNSFKAMVPFVG